MSLLLCRGRLLGDVVRRALLSTSPMSSASDGGDDSEKFSASTSSPHRWRTPGTEPWQTRQATAGSSGRTYNWPTNNLRVHPPIDELPEDSDERKALKEGKKPQEIIPAYICHMRAHIRYSPKKMQLISELIRGMSVEEAMRQLKFVELKGALAVAEVLKEAQTMAVDEHGVEFATNLWVAESFSSQSMIVKSMRRHARGRMGEISHRYVNYYVKLEEGKPPKEYYKDYSKIDTEAALAKYIEQHRRKHVPYHLEKDKFYY